jgi:D-tyrosyl-tRNA(Tyr) deacylase
MRAETKMRAVVQRVQEARVEVKGSQMGSIGPGLLIYLGIGVNDDVPDAEYLAEKILGLRIFEDANGKMNHSAVEQGSELMVVSQFTLYGDCRKGRRPSFAEAATPADARILYERFVNRCAASRLVVRTGVFQEMMKVYSVNDGPVTMLLDSGKTF